MRLYVYNSAGFDLWIQLDKNGNTLVLTLFPWEDRHVADRDDAHHLPSEAVGNWDVAEGLDRDLATGALRVSHILPEGFAVAVTVSANGYRGCDTMVISSSLH